MSAYISFYAQEEDSYKIHLADYDFDSAVFRVFERYASYLDEKELTLEMLLSMEKIVKEDEENAKLRLSDCAQLEQLLSTTTAASLDERVNLFNQICLDRARIEEELKEIQYAVHFLDFCGEIMNCCNTITYLFCV